MPAYPSILGPVHFRGSTQARIAAVDLEQPVAVSLTDSTGTIHNIPFGDAVRLANMIRALQSDLTIVDIARREAHHPALYADAAKLLHGGGRDPHGGHMLGMLYPANAIDERVSTPPGDSLNWHSSTPPEGTPFLRWHDDDDESGWVITLSSTQGLGVHGLGIARWNDPAGIRRLVETMQDEESVHALAAIMAPHVAARLTSRRLGRAMREAGSLPNVSIAKARRVLRKANLISEDKQPLYGSGRIRFVSIEVDGMKVPVSIAIVPPEFPGGTPVSIDPLLDQSQERHAARRDWIDRATRAFEDAGWFPVDLPSPKGWQVSTRGYLWVTLLKPEQWSRIRPAAADAANHININRGGVLN